MRTLQPSQSRVRDGSFVEQRCQLKDLLADNSLAGCTTTSRCSIPLISGHAVAVRVLHGPQLNARTCDVGEKSLGMVWFAFDPECMKAGLVTSGFCTPIPCNKPTVLSSLSSLSLYSRSSVWRRERGHNTASSSDCVLCVQQATARG